jgi:uncharacterized RDD family membrane protein YckC
MSSAIHFETPENVQISYHPAGLGTRFIGWLLDTILVLVVAVLLVAGTCFVGIVAGVVVEDLLQSAERSLEDAGDDQEQAQQVLLYFAGAALLVWSFSSFVYFMVCELLQRGQTLGKRLVGIRVVKVNGFSLDPLSIFVRNIFRVIDQLGPLWIVPVLSRRGQRFGDMAAGTVVVSDAPEPIPRVREELAGRSALDARYRFDHAALGRLRPVDFEAVEKLLDRWDEIPDGQLESLLQTMLGPLTRRLRVDPPAGAERLRFLEDLLAAEYRRQARSLG